MASKSSPEGSKTSARKPPESPTARPGPTGGKAAGDSAATVTPETIEVAKAAASQDDAAASQASASDVIDMDIFNQILELDDEESHEFSRDMVFAYFKQAGQTFREMDETFEQKDCAKLASLGHFLKGSSAALGVAKVQATCEKIQHLGQHRDDEAGQDLTDQAALDKIGPLLKSVKVEYDDAEKWLRNWYKEHGGEGEE